MCYYKIGHTESLCGEIEVQGSKNAALPVIAASILNKGQSVIKNCPDISDVRNMMKILEHLGCKTALENGNLTIDSSYVNALEIPREDVSKLRSSVVMLGALLGRIGWAKLSYPGGCNIGVRKIDVHLEILTAMGYDVNEQDEDIICKGRITGDCSIRLRVRSVGATENGILAAVISKGYTIRLTNTAKEPEIINMCQALNQMGAQIYGAGTDEIVIKGVQELHNAEMDIEADRIVAGTYMAAVTGVSGEVLLKNISNNYDEAILAKLVKLGMSYRFDKKGIVIAKKEKKGYKDRDIIISTSNYPGFPTDMQSQMMAVMSVGDGMGIIIENIFENRLKTSEMLNRMGAKINLAGPQMAIITGVSYLKGTEVEAMDLRGGAALIIGGLMAEGTTIVKNGEYILRGYQNIDKDLSLLGGNISLCSE